MFKRQQHHVVHRINLVSDFLNVWYRWFVYFCQILKLRKEQKISVKLLADVQNEFFLKVPIYLLLGGQERLELCCIERTRNEHLRVRLSHKLNLGGIDQHKLVKRIVMENPSQKHILSLLLNNLVDAQTLHFWLISCLNSLKHIFTLK